VTDDLGSRELLELARETLERPAPVMVGLWPRASALLGRQALEWALRGYWAETAPGVEATSARSQLLCLQSYVRDDDLAARTSHTWWILTRAVHHHAYELAPTADELDSWLMEVATIIDSLETHEG
jgi:hypothetical protein